MKTLNFGETKNALSLAICEAYERVNGLMKDKTFFKVMDRLQKRNKETLLKYIEFIEAGNNPNVDTAYVIALGTGLFLNKKN